jgi:putative transposase
MQLINGGYLSLLPLLNNNLESERNQLEKRWRMDETYIKVKGEWRYIYRAVNKEGNTIDFLLTKIRKRISAQIFK